MSYPPQPSGYGQPYGQQPPPVVSGPPQQYGPPPAGFYPPQPPPKKSNTGKIILGVVGGLLGLCVLGSVISAVAGDDSGTTGTPPKAQAADTGQPAGKPGDEPAPKKEAEKSTFNVAVGSTLTLDEGGGVQDWTLVSAKYRKSCGGLGDAEKGGFLIVDVRVTQKEGTGSVNPLFFNYVSDDGTTQDSLSGAFSGCEKDSLDATNSLRAGQKRSGQVVFDVASAKESIERTPGLGA